MCRIIRLEPRRSPMHLYWRFDRTRFITLCEDGSVVLDGRVMSKAAATAEMIRTAGIPFSYLWTE